jgi:hypothetical protein
MLATMRTLAILVALGAGAAACKQPGTYVDEPIRGASDRERGNTNGRSFDFVSTKPDGDEWTIRFRGDSMWVAYSIDDKNDDLGSFNLTPKEVRKVWNLVDDLNLPGRRGGNIDDEDGTVLFRLREPGGEDDEGHEVYTVYVSRSTEDEVVVELADYLSVIVERHTKERPNF